MASIFRKDDNYVEKMPRNTYDFSFQNNMTTDFGSLRPCMCLPVQPGDSFQFKPTFGLRFLPLVFPIQTRMKASIHYFYVRNRNLWKDWPDFIGRTKTGLVPPYIHLTESNRKQIETCQLGDFLGIPSEIYGSFTRDETIVNSVNYYSPEGSLNYAQATSSYLDTSPYSLFYHNIFNSVELEQYANAVYFKIKAQALKDNPALTFLGTFQNGYTYVSHIFDLSREDYPCVSRSQSSVLSATAEQLELTYSQDFSSIDSDSELLVTLLCVYNSSLQTVFNSGLDGSRLVVSVEYYGHKSVSELPLSQLPWRSDDNPSGIPLSVLPFRAYESIYNSFYRNAENNPLLINGVPEYNQWCRTQEGGADTNYYPIMYHNWEDDFLTTAVPSPQQGNAPLVGLSGTPTVTIGHDDGTTTTAQLDVDDEGNVTAVNAQSGDEATTQALVEAVSYGITINDFRNVNAFQRWLENNIRRGYKYRDQIKTHYGVTVRYDELDMPEFIGGTSQPVIVNQISQTAPTDDSVLGDMAGQASAVGSGKEITHYCDEHGFIIAILCVKPVANYSQLLPKFFNVTDAFDYYFPEFGHIGMQPITYKEVTPLQANLEGKLDDVFGYQRAWYDLISKTDEVHGLFRSDFRNFLINRTFYGSPELGKEFTVMDPDQLNEVFAVTENSDKILGQIYMDISKKTAIPLYGIPKLE